MSYLIAISISFLALLAYTVLVWVESKKEKRLFGHLRARLDRRAARVSYIARHIDWGAFIAHVVTTVAERIAHDVVHATLVGVRATERTLTRAIRILRERVALRSPSEVPAEGSQLLATVARFRKGFKKDKTTSG